MAEDKAVTVEEEIDRTVAALENELLGYEARLNNPALSDQAKEVAKTRIASVKTEIARVKKQGVTPVKETATKKGKETAEA